MVTEQANVVMVGLGEVKFSSDPKEILTCLGLGSCICVAVYDPEQVLGGMAHVVLPDSGIRDDQNPKFADIAVPMLVEAMEKKGSKRGKLIVKLAGGAHMAPVQAPGTSALRIGDRNADAVQQHLKEAGMKIAASDLGGSHGRTVRMWVESGHITVVTAGKDEKVL